MLVFTSAVAVGFAGDASSASNASSPFEAWRARFARSYASEAERAAAERAFTANDALIARHNALEGAPFELGHNAHSDLTAEGFNPNGYRAPRYDRNATAVEAAAAALADAPDAVDWVARGVVTPVKNQRQCGSCWAFAAAAAIESALAITYEAAPTSLSVEQLVACDTLDKGCTGGNAQNAYRWVRDAHPLCLDSEWPFDSGNGRVGSCHACKPVATLSEAAVALPANDEAAIKAAVATAPVSVAIAAYSSEFQLYKRGVFSSATCGTKLDHAVLLVGYGTDGKTGKDYWKLKNSWGASWGEGGYMRLERGANMCGVALEAAQPKGAATLTRPVPPLPPFPPDAPPFPPAPPAPQPAAQLAALDAVAAAAAALSVLCAAWVVLDLLLCGGCRTVGAAPLALHLGLCALLGALCALAYAAPPLARLVSGDADTLGWACSCAAPATAGACVAHGAATLGAQWATSLWLLAAAAALVGRGPAGALASRAARLGRAALCWGAPLAAAVALTRPGAAPWPRDDWCVVAGGAATLGWLGPPRNASAAAAAAAAAAAGAPPADAGLGVVVPFADAAAPAATLALYAPLGAAALLALAAALGARCADGARRRAALRRAAEGDGGASLRRALLCAPALRRLLLAHAAVWAPPLLVLALRWRGPAALDGGTAACALRAVGAGCAALVGFALQLCYLGLPRAAAADDAAADADAAGGYGALYYAGAASCNAPHRHAPPGGSAPLLAPPEARRRDEAWHEEQALAHALALSQAEPQPEPGGALSPLPPQWQQQRD